MSKRERERVCERERERGIEAARERVCGCTTDCTVLTERRESESVRVRECERARPGDDAVVATGGAEQLGTYKIVRAGIRHI